MTFKIFTKDTLKIIYHSCVCAATVTALVNLHADSVNTDPDGVHTDHDINTVPPQLTILSHDDTTDGEHSDFLMPFVNQQNSPKIVELIKDHGEQLEISLSSSN